MTHKQLLKQLGEDVLGWEFLETEGSLPKPSDALYQALDGKRRPVFWLCDNPNGTFQFFVAEPGTEATRWDPLENEKQREHVLAKVESLGGQVSVHETWIAVTRVDGHNITYAGSSPKRICEAALEAVSTESPGEDDRD